MSQQPPLASMARQSVLDGDPATAHRQVSRLIADVTGSAVRSATINADQYSLNSLNGQAVLETGDRYFFKFHSEEGEDATITEYYNAEMLRENGYLVDVPTFANGEPGRQILLYRLREDARLADVARASELGLAAAGTPGDAGLPGPATADEIVRAQEQRDRRNADCLLATLHETTAADVAAEPIHQLFHHRLVSPAQPGSAPVPAGRGGRVASFYVGQDFQLGELSIPWAELADLTWTINGIDYGQSLGSLFDEAGDRLAPARLDESGAVIAHGDDHNANIWFTRTGDDAEGVELVAFDPAFAGRHVPTLLADVKATFHNVFAHPLWLYEPGAATERYTVSVRRDGDRLHVEHDWRLSPLREAFLASKEANLWRPLLQELANRGALPADWERVVRLALMLCPTLVMNLRAGAASGHTPTSSVIALSQAISAGSEPTAGTDRFSAFIAAITPAGVA
ncbi:hypothetical protein [Cryobacterium sp.]|uniref:hypothetical protein n=1 Tax=Cryobacterium sp. TaxID=1926290 RepID=UPI00261CA59C|nr:hypothetical protein [Cryobacterium sp.]MCU1444498.1 hypothetical protein [Cryobacterium sp.]